MAQAEVLLFGDNGQDRFIWLAVREELRGVVRSEPLLELSKLSGIGLGGRKRDLVGVERTFDEFSVDNLWASPTLLGHEIWSNENLDTVRRTFGVRRINTGQRGLTIGFPLRAAFWIL